MFSMQQLRLALVYVSCQSHSLACDCPLQSCVTRKPTHLLPYTAHICSPRARGLSALGMHAYIRSGLQPIKKRTACAEETEASMHLLCCAGLSIFALRAARLFVFRWRGVRAIDCVHCKVDGTTKAKSSFPIRRGDIRHRP